jgi:predicted PurR-regulated permease PerM
MFIALVTGVYTFGLMGIIIGPVLISVLKAGFDAISAEANPDIAVAAAAEAGRAAAPASPTVGLGGGD